MKKLFTLLTALLCLLLLPACAAGRQESGKLKAVASAFPEYDLLRAVGGDLVEVTLLLKPGMEAHSFEPTPQDILAIRSASLFVYGGGESDVWADRLLASGDLGDIRVLAFMDHALLRKEEALEYMTVEEAEEEGDEYDEHVWTSPKNEILLTEALRDVLAIVLGPGSDGCVQLGGEAKRDLLVVGDRFPFLYLVREYGLRYAAAFPGCSGETDADPSTVAHLIDTVAAEGIPVVFKCDLSAGKLADTIAEATGAKVLTLYSAHTLSKTDFEAGETYLSLMERNLLALKEALN